MKALVLAVALTLGAGCASLSDVSKDAPASVDSVEAKLEAVIRLIRSDVQPFAQRGVELCKVLGPESVPCQALESAAGVLQDALEDADAGLELFKAGKITARQAYELVKAAWEASESYVETLQAAVGEA